jgi:hypothetical protein
MSNEIIMRFTKTFLRISALCVWAFLLVSCSETALNPEETIDDSTNLGSKGPITTVYSVGYGDLQFNLKCIVTNYNGWGYNAVMVNFANSEDASGYSLVLVPNNPRLSFTYNLGQVKIIADVTLYPASSNHLGSVVLECSYSKLNGSDVNHYMGQICFWNIDGSN